MKICLTAMVVLFMFAQADAQQFVQKVDSGRVVYLKADSRSKFPFSDAVRVGNMLYLSGQIGVDSMMHVVPGGVEAETRRAMEIIGNILRRNGASFDNVVKCTVMLADIKDWPAVNAIYRTYFKEERFPARSAFATTGLALGARIEIECWAVLP